MIHQYELKAREVHSYTAGVLKEQLNIEANGYCCKTEMVLDILIKASAECNSVEAVCADLEDTADSNTIRDYLNQNLAVKEIRPQEERANAALAECIPMEINHNIDKNRSTLFVGGFWEMDAPKGTGSEPPSPFPGVDKASLHKTAKIHKGQVQLVANDLATGANHNSLRQNLQEGKYVIGTNPCMHWNIRCFLFS